MSFYITLSSNTDSDYYPDNTLTHFFNKLPSSLNLNEGNWKVGLVDISYPVNWYNCRDKELWLYLAEKENEYVFISPGYYRNKRSFILMLNNKLHHMKNQVLKDAVTFRFDNATQKVTITRKKKQVVVVLSEKLERILGFEAKFWLKNQNFTRIIAPEIIDLSDGLRHLYIHTNIIEFRAVGQKFFPLLRILPVTEEDGVLNNSHSFQNIQYMSVRHQLFESIEIYITDGTGAKIPFERGTILLTLHFKQVS